MPLNIKKSDMGEVIKDFYKSKAPQFKGKSKSKRREMAIAAKLQSEGTSVGLKIARAIDRTNPPVGRPSLRNRVSTALKMREVDKSEKRRKSFAKFKQDAEDAKNRKQN